MKVYTRINRIGGTPFLSIVAHSLTDDDVIGIVDDLPARNVFLTLDMRAAQELLAELEVIVNSEMAEQEIRNALGAGKPEEM